MPTPTPKGQYRKVRYSDDGCTIYQCLWCLNTIEIRDDPEWSKWNFCPKCGKSWFSRLECRDSEVPRWIYDRWGNNPPSGIDWYGKRPESTATWVVESRYRWESDKDWGDWKHEYSTDKDPFKPDYKWAYSILNRYRHDSNAGYGFCDVQYRLRLIRKKDLTFMLDDVGLSKEEKSLVRTLYQKYHAKRK